MKFCRFNVKDTNCSSVTNVHIWDLPLDVKCYKKVGISSANLVIDEYKDQPELLIIKSNLIETSMENQNGVLGEIPLQERKFKSLTKSPFYTSSSAQIGLFVQ